MLSTVAVRPERIELPVGGRDLGGLPDHGASTGIAPPTALQREARWNPGIASSLSGPPVCETRLDIIGTNTPRRERRENERRLVADAAVLCLSTGVPQPGYVIRTPDRTIASVSTASPRGHPRRTIAMRRADVW
jgi:hypothetical protein